LFVLEAVFRLQLLLLIKKFNLKMNVM